MITQDEAIALAREVSGLELHHALIGFALTHEELTALCNAVRKQTLLEAAHEFQTESMYGFADTIEFLRRMAGVE